MASVEDFRALCFQASLRRGMIAVCSAGLSVGGLKLVLKVDIATTNRSKHV